LLNISFSIPVFPCRSNVLFANAGARRFFAAVAMQAGHTFNSWLMAAVFDM